MLQLELARTEAKQAGGADPEILLVADKRKCQDVKVIVGKLKETNREGYLNQPLERFEKKLKAG